ncbi:hypothetical protein [Blastococcus sp. TF02A-30]|uniref:hypothetical protein n=1 Tax=Blastococcus sp. TF02A-30 TaxID=2250580 RepID=UPI000DEB28E3|nr:hypothetical protein [Blastococcus sp. TF02A-30]RBY87585.1 hypothetical protein DQ241_09740 [Blastococcus sp. TF02A-30]
MPSDDPFAPDTWALAAALVVSGVLFWWLTPALADEEYRLARWRLGQWWLREEWARGRRLVALVLGRVSAAALIGVGLALPFLFR